MPDSTTFRLNRSGVLLVLISAAFASQAQAAAGRVEFAIGGATVAGPNGQQRPVTRGAEVNSGDIVRTTDGRVQVRMADGAYISLQPNTEFGIKDYRYEGKTDGNEGAFYSLLKGAMRTVTGLIGRVNRNRYQVATPTATVGIRGTGGLIQILDDGSTLVQGTSGIWFLANPSGSINVPAGVSGISPSDPNQSPRETEAPPSAGPAPLPPEQGYVQGDQTTPDGKPVIIGDEGVTPPLLVSGSGYTAAISYCCTFTVPWVVTSTGATATFDTAGRMTQIVDGTGMNFKADPDPAKVVDFGNDGTIAWGRWIGNVTGTASIDGLTPLNENYTPNQGMHYAIGLPTASMPQVGTAIAYNLLGATKPTLVDGSAAPGTFAGTLSVNFDVRSPSVTLNASVNVGALGYTFNATSPISGNQFNGSFVQGQGIVGTNVSSCQSGCNASVQGFFAGSSAERAGLGYHINDFLANKDIVGAAAFIKATQ